MPDFVPCYKAFDSQEAALIATRLEGHGIRTKTVGGAATIGYGDLPAAVFAVEVWIPADRLEEAQVLIREHLEEHKGKQPDRALGEWTCPRCGEQNDADFAICWSCQASRP